MRLYLMRDKRSFRELINPIFNEMPIIARLYGTFEIVVGKKTLQVYNNSFCACNVLIE